MNNEQVQKYWDEVVLKQVRGLAKILGIEFNENIARIVLMAYDQGCNYTRIMSADEFIGKDAYHLMHSTLVERIIEAIKELGVEEIDIKNGPFISGVKAYVGEEIETYGATVDRVRINGSSIICEEKGECHILQNELSFADLLRIYRNIPYKEGW